MTLDTIQVSIRPQDALNVLKGHDRRDEPFSLVMENGAPDLRGSVLLNLWVDGSDTGTSVLLMNNGTWQAYTHVVLGEKAD